MQHHRIISRLAITGIAGAAIALTFGNPAVGRADQASALPVMATLSNTYAGTPDATPVGGYDASAMSVELVLAPRSVTALNTELKDLYTKGNASYHDWLKKGQFDELYGPSATTTADADSYLESQGLKIEASSSPFLVRALGSSATVAHAFETGFESYRSAAGESFFDNTRAVSLPATLAPQVLGIVGLSNTDRYHALYQLAAGEKNGAAPKYGAGPDGSGLTPKQTDGIYNADPAIKAHGSAAQGAGEELGVFELSGYTESDIIAYAKHFYGTAYANALEDDIDNVNVDGGPITSSCPVGDECVPPPDYSGDIEVEADLEQDLAIAPDASDYIVYNAPNDETGETEIDEYNAIASSDTAASISSSWGECEQDEGAGSAYGESLAFEQMASQGQSITAAAGDTGAFDCLRDGTSNAYDIAVDDPASQIYVLAVGGTSLVGFDPQTNQNPSYPTGYESDWNVLDLCSDSEEGIQLCGEFGSGGGGVSSFWEAQSWQTGPGVPALYNRMVPDVSANADEYTGYAEYCTGSVATNSECAQIGLGWFGIGGTSLAAPLWAALTLDMDSYSGTWQGDLAPQLYSLAANDPGVYLHDITGKYQTDNNNGYYYTQSGYSLATGLGTPNMTELIENGTS